MSQLPQSLKHLAKARGLRGAPKAARALHALSKDQRTIMRQKGFLPREIREFDKNSTTDFHSVDFQTMLRSRARWVEAMRLNKWTDIEIARRINRFLNRKGRSPWDFFRGEYDKRIQSPRLSISKFKGYLENRRIISANFGRAYGRIQSVKVHYYKGLPGLPRKKS